MGWLDDENQADSIFGGDDYFSSLFRSGLQRDEYNPEDPEAKSYMDLAKQPPPSEALYSDYLSQRPILGGPDTKPSVGRRLISAVAAMSDPINGITTANQINRQPYEHAFVNWKTSGTELGNRARLADSARNRELNVTKESLNMRARKEREDRLTRSLDERLKSKTTAENLAREKEDRFAAEAKTKEDRAHELELLRLRNEQRQIALAERQQKASDRAEETAKIAKEEKSRKLAGAREEKAQLIAYQRAKQDFAEYYKNSDPENFDLKSNTPANIRARINETIKSRMALLKKTYGLSENSYTPDSEEEDK